ncbi:hypothetical protein TNCV_4430301 [Trichonephila clavipes]|nr:hypothetical protein TNCV_4430301 [Trichonephila clavipes]
MTGPLKKARWAAVIVRNEIRHYFCRIAGLCPGGTQEALNGHGSRVAMVMKLTSSLDNGSTLRGPSSRWCGVVVRRGGASSGVVHVT